MVLMVLGIGLFGLIAATQSSFFVEQQHKGQFQLLIEKIDALERKIEGTVDAAAMDDDTGSGDRYQQPGETPRTVPPEDSSPGRVAD